MASIVGGGTRGGSNVFGSKPSTIAKPSPVADLRRVTPFYDEMNDLISGNILSGLQGVLPPSVTQAVIDAGVSRAVAGGFGGSGLGNNLVARDLGLTSKAIQDLAFNQALNFTGNQSRTATLDPSIQTQIDQYNSLVRASPDPTARANWELAHLNKIQNPTESALPFGSRTTAIPSGGMPNFTPLRDWSAPKVSLGVNPYVPNYFTPGSPMPRTPAPTTSFAPFIPTGGGGYNETVASTISNLESQRANPTVNPVMDRNTSFNLNGTPDPGSILRDAGINPSIYMGMYNPVPESYNRDTERPVWDTFTFNPFAEETTDLFGF